MYSNICTTIATSLALNFIAANNLDSAVVPFNKRFDLLTGRATAATVTSLYPNANSLHRTLTDRCSMESVNDDTNVITGVNAYMQLLSTDTDIVVQQLITQASVRNEIDSGRPWLITTIRLSGEYNFYTMVIYGYRLTETDDYENLVHTGWYSNLVQVFTNIY